MSDRRMVAVRLTALGDVLLATPALRALAHAHPDAPLTLVTSPAYAPLLEGLDFLDRVVPWARGRPVGELARALKADGPVTTYVDLQHKVRTAVLGRRLGAPRRLAFRRRTLTGGLAALVGRDAVRQGRHATRLYLDALELLGVDPPRGKGALTPAVALPEAARDAGARAVAALGRRPVVAVAPGATWATKRWDPARFAAVARHLAEARGAALVLVGGPGDGPALEACRAAVAFDLDASDRDLPGLAGVLAATDVLVAGDTGLAHLASAVGAPVVSVFGPTAPSRWAPAGSRVLSLGLDCSPCSNHGAQACPLGHHRCLADLAPAPVIAAALAVLDGAAPAGDPAAAGRGGEG